MLAFVDLKPGARKRETQNLFGCFLFSVSGLGVRTVCAKPYNCRTVDVQIGEWSRKMKTSNTVVCFCFVVHFLVWACAPSVRNLADVAYSISVTYGY